MGRTTKTKTRLYFTSQLADSQNLPDFLKESLEREPCVYRVTKHTNNLSKKEKRESQERVSENRVVNLPDGKELKIPLVHFDKKGFRYYKDFGELKELIEFMTDMSDNTDIGLGIEEYDSEDENQSKYLEAKFGLNMGDALVCEVKDYIIAAEGRIEELEEMIDDMLESGEEEE